MAGMAAQPRQYAAHLKLSLLLLVGIIFFSSGFWQNFQGIAGNINLYAASVIEFLYNFSACFYGRLPQPLLYSKEVSF